MSALHVEIFTALFAVALTLSIVAESFGIPAPVLLVLVGAILHAAYHFQIGFDFGPALLFVFLPPLIFEAAWGLNLSGTMQRLGRIFYLAVPGTMLTAGLVTLGLHAGGILPWPAAAIFGAVICATDPVAVVSVFRRVRMAGTVKTIVEAESLLNDGIAVVLYTLALQFATPGAAHITPYQWLLEPLLDIAGGILVGLVGAFPLWLALRTTKSSDYEVALTVVLAYASYLMAQHFGFSGIIATTCSALTLRTLLHRTPTLSHRKDVNIFWSSSAALVNTFVFFVTGLIIEPAKLLNSPLLVIIAISAMLIARVILALTGAITLRARVVIFLAGMRGSLPLALALSIPITIAGRDLIIDGVAACVIITLLINGIPLLPVLQRLYPEVDAGI